MATTTTDSHCHAPSHFLLPSPPTTHSNQTNGKTKSLAFSGKVKVAGARSFLVLHRARKQLCQGAATQAWTCVWSVLFLAAVDGSRGLRPVRCGFWRITWAPPTWNVFRDNVAVMPLSLLCVICVEYCDYLPDGIVEITIPAMTL